MDLFGKVFGRLTVIGRCDENNKYWICLCECGKHKKIIGKKLTRTKHTKSCGCLNKEIHSKRLTTHGQTSNGNKTPEYNTWKSMKDRCKNKNDSNYGGRGITVCERWLDFKNFFEDMGIKPSPGHSIDRIDNNKGYFPENCRWATMQEQHRNYRQNRAFEHNGVTYSSLAEISETFGINYRTLYYRISKGLSIEESISRPINKMRIHQR